MKKRSIVALLITVVFSFGLAAGALCAEKKPLVVGAIFSVSGPASWLGDPEKKTTEMIEAQVNAAGGINGFPVKFIVEDDEGKEPKSVAGAEKLISKDQVLAIVGPSLSGTTMSIKDICEKNQIPLVSCAAAEIIINPLAKFVFKTPQVDSHVAIRIYEQMKKMGIKKVGVITGTDVFGKEGRKQLNKYAKDYGIEIVADETYAPTDTDMTAQLKKIDSAGAKAVVNWSIVPAQSIIPKNMKQLEMKAILFQSHGFGNPKYIAAAGEAAEGIIFPAGSILVADTLPANHWHKKVLTEYKTAYEKKYPPPVSTFGGHAYDALWIVLDAMKRAKITPDMDVKEARKKIRDEIENTKKWIGIHGEFNMSTTDHVGLDKDKSLEMLYVDKGGKIVPYFTIEEKMKKK